MQVVRWLIVAGAILLARYGAETYEPLRVLAAVLFLSFLVWPNLTYHLVLASRRILPSSKSRKKTEATLAAANVCDPKTLTIANLKRNEGPERIGFLGG